MSTADRWRSLIQQQQSGDLSVAAFCRRAGVSQPSFYAWRRKLQAEVAFAEVKVSPASMPEKDGLELRLADGGCIVVRPGFDRRTLLELLDALETHSTHSPHAARAEVVR